jgi:hypothetical protein
VKLSFPYRTIRQSHVSEAFSLPPPARAVEFPQTRKLANRFANRERFHVRKIAADLKKHYLPILSNRAFGCFEEFRHIANTKGGRITTVVRPTAFHSPSSGTKKPIGAFALYSIYAMLAFWYYGIMATRKMTFSVPEPLAVQFLRRVASRDRSRFVSEAVAARLEERDAALIRACEIANQDLDVAEIGRDFDGIGDEMAEPWK